MKPKEFLQHIGKEAAKFHERIVLSLEPVFVHKPDCTGAVILKRTVENKPSFRIIYRQCESCRAQDSFEEKYPDFTRIGW